MKMDLMWNDRRLTVPSIYTKPQHPLDLNLSSLRRLLEKMISTYATSTFDETAALTSRLIARRTQSFRSQAGFKQLRKTSIALSRLQNVNIVGVMENFLGTLPDYMIEGSKIDLPTYDNFQFAMVRLQSLSKLLLRIAVCARDCSTIFRDMIQRHFFIEISVLYIGVLAQIWNLAKYLSITTRDFYNALYPYGKYFKSKKKLQVEVSLENLILPDKLDSFLGVEWTNEFFGDEQKSIPAQQTTEQKLGIDFGAFDDDGDNVFSIREENKIPTRTIELKKIVRQEFRKIETKTEHSGNDIGVAISRDSVVEINVDRIAKVEDISKLVSQEDLLRQNRCAKRTRHLSDSQWKNCKSKIRNILVTSEGKICIKKFKNLWKSVAK